MPRTRYPQHDFMRIVCISDTHNCNERIFVPEGDLLVHSGDATISGTAEEITRFDKWFSALPHKHKIFVAGNHDWLFERDNARAQRLLDPSIIYLQDAAVEIEGLKIYGSPWQPRFYDWAFNLGRGAEIAEKWKLIPNDVSVLITHGPPKRTLDAVPHAFGFSYEGCADLSKRIGQIANGNTLRAHIFGHIHYSHGIKKKGDVAFINASICDEDYMPTNLPITIEI